jgi:diguanylate cyclase (GGDEF)-like protein
MMIQPSYTWLLMDHGDGQRVPVPYARLVDMLGASTYAAGLGGERGAPIELRWPCECSAIRRGRHEKVALWRPCGAHVDIFIARHESRLVGPGTQSGRRKPLRRWRRSFGAFLVFVLGTAVVEAMLALLRRVQRAEAESIIDSLTGLYNRRGWERRALEECTRLQRQPEATMIFMMDLDDLKGINDLEGHAAGDAALISTAEVIMSVTRQHDVASRLGGDEFGLLATCADDRAARLIEERLLNGFNEKGLSVSIGRCQVNAQTTMAEAMQNADREMYAQKAIRHAEQETRALRPKWS